MFANSPINDFHAVLSVIVPQSCEHPAPQAWGSCQARVPHQCSPRRCKESSLWAYFLKLCILQGKHLPSLLPSIFASLIPFKITNCTYQCFPVKIFKYRSKMNYPLNPSTPQHTPLADRRSWLTLSYLMYLLYYINSQDIWNIAFLRDYLQYASTIFCFIQLNSLILSSSVKPFV